MAAADKAGVRREAFLSGDGEMASLIRNKDWRITGIGDIAHWPQALRTSVGICLQTKFPALIMWGEDLVYIYNDAYREIIGKKHPAALGEKAKDVWIDLWDTIGSKLQNFLKDGQPIYADNQLYILNRKGYTEECYFSFSYSAVYDETGKIAGIFTMVTETTGAINYERQMQEQLQSRKLIEQKEERLRMVIEATQLGTWEFYPLSGQLIWSVECKNIYGLAHDKEVDFALFAEHIYPDDRDFVQNQVQKSMNPDGDGNYDISYRILRFDDNSLRWIHAKGKVFFNEERKADRFIGTVVDITENKAYEQNLLESEQRTRIAIEAADMGSFDWDLGADVFYSSERLLQIFGFKGKENISHAELIARFHPEDKFIRDKAVDGSFATGSLQYEARIIWEDETIHWVTVYGKVMHDTNKDVKRMYGIVADITEQKSQSALLEKIVEERTLSLKLSNEELKKSEERYYKMTEEVEDYSILLLSPEGIILNWNKGAERIKGYQESEIIGRHFSTFYLPADKEKQLPEKMISEASLNGRAANEGWRQRKNGSSFWSSVVITALHDESNHIIGFSKVTRDLTEKKLAEDRLQQYTRELEAQNKELEQFAYIASHDLQEPLRKIQTFTEVLEKNLKDEAIAKKYLDKVKSSAERMGQLIRSVLDYSRLSITDIQLIPVDLNFIIENVQSDLELLISEKKVTVTHTRLPIVKGIPLQLQQLFSNLVSNAIKFSEKEPLIHISSRRVTEADIEQYPDMQKGVTYTEIICKDNGIGFEQKYAAKIFTIFQRLHGQKSYPGTGIGLALCKKIVENNQGYIRVESEPGKGSSFFVYLQVVT